MSHPTANLRALVMNRMRTDSDLDAFCSDHFPEVFHRFANGMDRVQKVTLLLQCAEHERLTALLHEWPRPNDISTLRPSKENSTAEQRNTSRTRLGLVLAGSCLLLLATTGARHLFLAGEPDHSHATAVPDLTSTAEVHPDLGMPSRLRLHLNLDSVPTGARVTRWDRTEAEAVAVTPVNMPIARPKNQLLRLQLEKHGFQTVELQIPIQSTTTEVTRSITMRRTEN